MKRTLLVLTFTLAACGSPLALDPAPPLVNALTEDGGSATYGPGSSGSSGSSGFVEHHSNADAGADASPLAPLAGTWTGPYDLHVPGACPTDDVGTLTLTLGAPASRTVTTDASFSAMQVYTAPCVLTSTVVGTAEDAIDVSDEEGSALSGTWIVRAGSDTSWLSFSATRSGRTLTGAWTCPDCKGSFTLTAAP